MLTARARRRSQGRREIWDALRAACSADDVEMAQAIVDSANVILPTGQLTEAYDELGNKYTIPLFCICEPANLQDGGARQPAEVADTPSSAVRKPLCASRRRLSHRRAR